MMRFLEILCISHHLGFCAYPKESFGLGKVLHKTINAVYFLGIVHNLGRHPVKASRPQNT